MASPANTKLFLQFALGFLFGVFLTYVTIGYHTEQSNWNFNSDLDDPHHLRRNHEEFTRHRVLCLVMTSPAKLHTNGKAVKDTWGKSCNKLLFMSMKEDPNFPVVGLKVEKGKDSLWDRSRAAWLYVLDHHLNDIDWFLKADDDNFVIVENLRHFIMVAHLNSEEPHYLGRHFRGGGGGGKGYCSEGAGYVFSRETLRQFGALLQNPSKCSKSRKAKDVDKEVGKCLAEVGIYPGDTRDSRGRKTFHPLSPGELLIPGHLRKDFWLRSYDFYPFKGSSECCSDHSVTYRTTSAHMMYYLEHFVYHLMPFGIAHSKIKANTSGVLGNY